MSYDAKRFADDLDKVLVELKELLVSKNEKYGDSVLNPTTFICKLSPRERIKVRMEDKLSRMTRGVDSDDEDARLDLLGYLILERIAINREAYQRECERILTSGTPLEQAILMANSFKNMQKTGTEQAIDPQQWLPGVSKEITTNVPDWDNKTQPFREVDQIQ